MLAAGDDLVEGLKALGVSYALFAAAHPAHFRVMHDPSLGLDTSEKIEEIHARKKVNLRELIVHGQAQGLVRPGDPDMLALLCVSVVGGLARLFVDGGPECPIVMPMQNLGAVEHIARAIVELAGFGLLSNEERPRYEARSTVPTNVPVTAPSRPAKVSTTKRAPKKPAAKRAPKTNSAKAPAARSVSRAQPGSPRAPRRSRSGPAR